MTLAHVSAGSGGTTNKDHISRYLEESNLYGVITVDKPGGNYILWIPQLLCVRTGVIRLPFFGNTVTLS